MLHFELETARYLCGAALLFLGVVFGWWLLPAQKQEAFASALPITRGKPLSPRIAYPAGPLGTGSTFDRLEVNKTQRRMYAYSHNKLVRVYAIALGGSPQGHKVFEGDNKTPEGSYTIDNKNPNSAFYKNLNISYPNGVDRATAQKIGKSPGGAIKIHGLAPAFSMIGAAHQITDWTNGCVAVTNEEMEELYQRVPLGTPITLLP